jgi:hypothetical protein
MKSVWWLASILDVIVVIIYGLTVLVKEHDIATGEIDSVSSAEAGDCE